MDHKALSWIGSWKYHRPCAAVEKIDAADKWYLSANVEQQRKEGVWRICQDAPGLKWLRSAYICSGWSRQSSNYYNPCRISKIVWANVWCWLRAKYKICDVEEDMVFHCVTIVRSWTLLPQSQQSTPHIQESTGMQWLSHKFIARIVGRVITIENGNCIHHFEDTICSCRYYLVIPTVCLPVDEFVLLVASCVISLCCNSDKVPRYDCEKMLYNVPKMIKKLNRVKVLY